RHTSSQSTENECGARRIGCASRTLPIRSTRVGALTWVLGRWPEFRRSARWTREPAALEGHREATRNRREAGTRTLGNGGQRSFPLPVGESLRPVPLGRPYG